MATPYSFIQPIRYYKANDPYYYEVDNIPLRQLEENILYIKNKLEGGDGDAYLTQKSELNLYNIRQLRPKSIGGRVIQVNAGRFVSRVNDAFNIPNPLDKIGSIDSYGFTGMIIRDLDKEWTPAQRDKVWEEFINGSREYNINGLEFTYTFQNSPVGLGASWGVADANTNYPKYNNGNKIWPGQSVYGSLAGSLENSFLFSTQITGGSLYSAANLNTIHLSFVKMWRGVFRTTVVDFPNTTINIPVFNEDDYSYVDDNGVKHNISDVVQRIDLLVAYSLPIDSSSTTTQSFQGGATPETLTTPTLGIVRGAGIGIKKDGLDSIHTLDGAEFNPDYPYTGTSKIVGNKGDSSNNAESMGITNDLGIKIHGSFPSPDDLLNIAPLLALDVESDNFQLIGQAALPLAYVVVTKGSTVVTQNDIIDIRPFLRTTEFTYNERAGIAAANPPLSFANPAVGAFQLRDIVDKIEVAGNLLSANLQLEKTKSNGRVLYTDYVMGGLAYGVEGTLLTMCDADVQPPAGPWGSEVLATTYKAADGQSYPFNIFNSSKAYLESGEQVKKDAYLEYVYNTRQDDLKKWLNDPNAADFDAGNGTYLGMGSTRNIPLYPEWDPPLDSQNYVQVMDLEAGASPSPKPTWWMWMEGQGNRVRPLVYVPGAFAPPSSPNADTPYSYLNKWFGWGFASNSHDKAGKGMINVCTKKLEVEFPDWVNDYDILVEYVNCAPVTSAGQAGGENDSNAFGLGGGLYINKGSITMNQGGKKTAILTVNSASQPWPIKNQNANLNKQGFLNVHDEEGGDNYHEAKDGWGQITDATKGVPKDYGEGGRKQGVDDSTTVEQSVYQHLSYSVCVPQFRQTKFNVNRQSQTIEENNPARYTPKFGASFYPTVKYTIIGYEVVPFSNNEGLGSINNFTAVGNGNYQNNGVDIGALRKVGGFQSEGPLTYLNPTRIIIQNTTS
tara:strand:+ start:25546 stop:28401 length:2856 start_codon:yes stop_codon:yes gene_type:complete